MSASSTYQLRQILENRLIISFLLKNDPNNHYLKFEDKQSSKYQCIVSWCNIKKDFKQDKYGTMKGHGMFYDTSRDAFVYLNNDHMKTAHIEDVISFILPGLKCSENMLGAGSWFDFVDEKYFSPQILELLEKEGYLSKVINIPINLIHINKENPCPFSKDLKNIKNFKTPTY